MIWRASTLLWLLWGVALVLWFVMGRGEVTEGWVVLLVLWVLNGGLLWLASRST